MKAPTTIDDVQLLITNQVQESLHLDYKASTALLGKPGEIAKDVSAFANSDGGLIIYGVEEQKNKPVRIDDGIEHKRYSREWLEQVIHSNVSPRIDNLQILAIPLNETHSIYIVTIPRSERAPHQEREKNRYYKRYNFASVPMEDYEIQDIRNRHTATIPLVVLDVEIDQEYAFMIYVENVGTAPAIDVKFDFSEKLFWKYKEPQAFKNGIRVLSPARKLAFFYAGTVDALSANSQVVNEFTVSVSYFNPIVQKRISDNFFIDLKSFENSIAPVSEIRRLNKDLLNSLRELKIEVKRVADNLGNFETLAGATGLDFSFSTWRNIASTLGKELQISKIDPKHCHYTVFKEVLDIDMDTAMSLLQHFRQGHGTAGVEDMLEISSDTKKLFYKYFISDPTDVLKQPPPTPATAPHSLSESPASPPA